RRGYRFIGELDAADRLTPAETIAVIPENDQKNRQAEPAPRHPRLHLRSRVFVPVLLAGMILMVWASVGYYRRGVRPFVTPLQPLMRLDVDLGKEVPGSERGANAILSPD